MHNVFSVEKDAWEIITEESRGQRSIAPATSRGDR